MATSLFSSVEMPWVQGKNQELSQPMPRCSSSLHIQQSVGRLQSRASWPILSQYCHNLILHRHLISDRHRHLTITNFHLSNENYIAHEQKKLTKIALSKVNKTLADFPEE